MMNYQEFSEDLDKVKLQPRDKVHKGYYIKDYIYVYCSVSCQIDIYQEKLTHSSYLARVTRNFCNHLSGDLKLDIDKIFIEHQG